MARDIFAVGVGILLVLASVGMVGVAAATSYDTDYSGDADVLISNQTTAASDLDTIFADVETVTDINGDGTTTTSTDIRFEVHGVNESTTSNYDVLVNETRTVSQNSTENFDFQPTDTYKDDYNSFYLHVQTVPNGTSDHVLNTDHGALYTTSGALGGGGLLGGAGGLGTPVLAVGALGVGYLLLRD